MTDQEYRDGDYQMDKAAQAALCCASLKVTARMINFRNIVHFQPGKK